MSSDQGRARPGDRGSMPLAMLLTIVATAAAGLIGVTVVAQIRNTGYDTNRAAAVDAAQSGMETALAQIRALPVNGAQEAAASTVPCYASGANPNVTMSGKPAESSSARFTVRVYYLAAAPPPDADQETWAKANRLPCAPGAGVSTVPMYALLAATGTSGSASRTLAASYLFQSRTKPNVPGGTIKIYNSDQCLAAPRALTGTTPLAPGSQVVLATCSASDPKQVFTYNPTLQVELKDSAGSAAFPAGACLSAASVDHTPVTFQNCDSTKRIQIWSLNNRDNYEGTTDGVNPNGKCWNVNWAMYPPAVEINNVIAGNANRVAGTQGDGTDGTPCSGISGDYTRYKTFFPDPSAGTGAAGDVTRQLVNYEQFGRCLDVTANNVLADFLVVFPCKQAPNKVIQWNQVWFLPTVPAGATSATGRVILKDSGGATWCLYSPGSIAPQQWVRITPCTPGSAIPPSQLWRRSVFTGVNQTSYRIESTYATSASTPHCLMPAMPPASAAYWTGNSFDSLHISKLVLGACNGSSLQKWNASPSVLASMVSGYAER